MQALQQDTSVPEIIRKDLPEIIDQADLLTIAEARQIKVVDHESRRVAGELSVALAKIAKKYSVPVERFNEWKKGKKKLLDDSYNQLVVLFTKPFDDVQKHLSTERVQWDQKEEDLRIAEEQRLQREATAKEEKERQARADEARKAGNPKLAKAILKETPIIPIVELPSTKPEIAGESSGTYYSAEVTGYDDYADGRLASCPAFKQLIDAVCKGQVPMKALMPNMVYLNGEARNLQKELRIPGVVVRSKTNMKATGR